MKVPEMDEEILSKLPEWHRILKKLCEDNLGDTDGRN